MRENKRRREDEMNGTSAVQEEAIYPNESISLSLKQEPNAELLSHNQHLIITESVTQNQQFVQKLRDQDQNLIYFLVPTNENVQLPLPVSFLPDQHVSEPSIYYISNRIEEQSCDPLKQEPDVQEKQQNVNNTSTNNVTHVYGSAVKSKTNALRPMIYHCDFPHCFELFHSLYDKKLHLDSHKFPENNEFKCGICNMKFSRAIDRNKHIENHAVVPTHKCRDCQKDFSYLTVLIKHLREKKCSVNSPIICFFCKCKITDFDDLIRHHQLPMKQCHCGIRKCGTHVFEMHSALCNLAQQLTCERKKIKVDTGESTLMK